MIVRHRLGNRCGIVIERDLCVKNVAKIIVMVVRDSDESSGDDSDDSDDDDESWKEERDAPKKVSVACKDIARSDLAHLERLERQLLAH